MCYEIDSPWIVHSVWFFIQKQVEKCIFESFVSNRFLWSKNYEQPLLWFYLHCEITESTDFKAVVVRVSEKNMIAKYALSLRLFRLFDISKMKFSRLTRKWHQKRTNIKSNGKLIKQSDCTLECLSFSLNSIYSPVLRHIDPIQLTIPIDNYRVFAAFAPYTQQYILEYYRRPLQW